MSKESTAGYDCPGCGQRFAFMDYHWPHCKMNPNNLSTTQRAHVGTVFTKSELATIAQEGPMRGQPAHSKGRRKR